MKFREVQTAIAGVTGSSAITPRKTLRLEPSDFSDTWKRKPDKGIVVGLRLLSDADETAVRQNAARLAAAEADTDTTVELYNSSLRSGAVALAICDPNDVERGHPVFPMAEDTVPEALTSRTITRLFDELEKLQIESSPLFLEATDEELRMLSVLLASDEPLSLLPSEAASRVRRYLAFALSELLDSEAENLQDEDVNFSDG